MTESESKAREHLAFGGGTFPSEWVVGLIEEIDMLRRTNDALKSAPTVTELCYKHDALSGCNGYGKFNLRQLDRDRWSIDLNNEHIELYNKRGRGVGGLCPGPPAAPW